MRFRIFSTAVQQIAAHAVREHPHEACGLLLGNGDRIDRAVAARNVAADPARAFEIDPALLLRCHREARAGGLALLGWYHSHPDGRDTPSAADAARVAEWGRLWLIATAAGVRGYAAVPDGPIAGRFAAVELIILPPGAPE
jgi:proteasome lid subunit RPN8/RPN11